MTATTRRYDLSDLLACLNSVLGPLWRPLRDEWETPAVRHSPAAATVPPAVLTVHPEPVVGPISEPLSCPGTAPAEEPSPVAEQLEPPVAVLPTRPAPAESHFATAVERVAVPAPAVVPAARARSPKRSNATPDTPKKQTAKLPTAPKKRTAKIATAKPAATPVKKPRKGLTAVVTAEPAAGVRLFAKDGKNYVPVPPGYKGDVFRRVPTGGRPKYELI